MSLPLQKELLKIGSSEVSSHLVLCPAKEENKNFGVTHNNQLYSERIWEWRSWQRPFSKFALIYNSLNLMVLKTYNIILV